MRENSRHATLCRLRPAAVAVAFILAAMLLSGCRAHNRCMVVEKTITDSVFIRDTVIQVAIPEYRDSVTVAPDDMLGDTARSFLSNPYSGSWAEWDGRMLHHSLFVWPGTKISVNVPHYVTRWRRVETEVPVYIKREFTRIEKFRMTMGDLSMIAIAAILLYRYIAGRGRRFP